MAYLLYVRQGEAVSQGCSVDLWNKMNKQRLTEFCYTVTNTKLTFILVLQGIIEIHTFIMVSFMTYGLISDSFPKFSPMNQKEKSFLHILWM